MPNKETHFCSGVCSLCKVKEIFIVPADSYDQMRDTGAVAETRCLDPKHPDERVEVRCDKDGTFEGKCSRGARIIFSEEDPAVAKEQIRNRKRRTGRRFADRAKFLLRKHYLLKRPLLPGSEETLSFERLETMQRYVDDEGYGE